MRFTPSMQCEPEIIIPNTDILTNEVVFSFFVIFVYFLFGSLQVGYRNKVLSV